MAFLRVLGVDPALRNFGLVRARIDLASLETPELVWDVEDMDVIKTANESGKTVRKSSDDLRRAMEMHKGFHGMAKGCALIFAEIPSGSQSARANISAGMSIGVLASSPVPIVQVQPIEAKKKTVGRATATKDEMIDWATARFPNAPWRRRKFRGKWELLGENEHMADGCAIIKAGLETDQFLQVASMYHAAIARAA
ncbi:hypothetical protein [Inquilinus sp. OTU3971]|uniref:hypothetical protein n=1 Tax=Inquilinus sp. OTU3971 TaxID=3043855 RepID=UPI00313ABC43